MMIKNKHLRSFLIVLCVIFAAAVTIGIALLVDNLNNKVSEEITVSEAQSLIDDTFAGLPNNVAKCSLYVQANSTITVNSVEFGTKKDVIMNCTYKTIDVKSVIEDNIDSLLNIEVTDPVTGKAKNATKIQIEINNTLLEKIKNESAELTGEIVIKAYETKDRGLVVYLSDETVDTVFGGLITAHEKIKNTNEITVNGQVTDISNRTSLRNGLIACIALKNYDSDIPDTSSWLQRWWNSFSDEFYSNFIEDGRWMYLVKGLGVTVAITLCALLLGLAIGFLVAIVRCTYERKGTLKILNGICKLYLIIIRGTPVMIQLMIIYFVLLLPIGIEKFPAAVLCFGLNSGAYVAEIVRGGIMSVDRGQEEAGRSLGFNDAATMWHIIIPQAFKAILPSLANEFITLLKESSVAFYIGVSDLTQSGLKIRSITYSNFMPLIAIALIYLVMVLGLSYLVSILERRLRQSDR